MRNEISMSLSFSYPIACKTGGYNELLDETGEIRPHWRAFFGAFAENGAEKLAACSEQVARLMNADVPAAARSVVHGVIPFILSDRDFQTLSTGLIRRARLMNRVLSDLYGEQRLITNGVLPPDVVYANPAYFPALKNLRPAGGVFLQEYAVDVERAPDGRFWVVADKTQAPEGIGLTIKNRRVLSRVMPDIYEKAAPARLSDYFESLRRHLFSCAPEAADKSKIPTIVMLCGGVKKKLSFEESFFARGLGVAAVDPTDLTVRGNRVYLKNIDGLKPVDVILRRVDDGLCDPLELNGASVSGVAGLVNAARSGTVSIVNPPGSGLAEIPALRAFIHGISRFFDDEDLPLPSVAAWWCGQEREKNYVLDHLSELKIYDITGKKVCPSREDIESDPANYVAQERVNASLTPALQNGVPVPARARLRFHLIHENGDYRVMKGGLAFTQAAAPALRDIWVETPATAATAALPQTALPATKPVRTTFELTSGIADNMFWLGRNLERGEQQARLLRVAVERMTGGPEIPEPNDVATLLSILALAGHLPFDDYRDPVVRKKAMNGLRDIIASPDYGFGLHFLFSRLRDMADLLHDRLSMDTWELFRRLPPLLPPADANPQILLNRLNEIILCQNALAGLICEDMTRDHGWRFLEIGKRLERAMQILTLMSGVGFCANNGFNASLETILETMDSRMTYRVRYMSVPTVPLVFDLLICDVSNPRALIYQVLKLAENIAVLKRESRLPDLFSKESALLENAIEHIRSVDVLKLAEQGRAPDDAVVLKPAFSAITDGLRAKLREFSDTLTLSCFVHAASTRQGPAYNKGKRK